MLTCRELVERLGAMVDGDLDTKAVRVIERHLGKCHPCAQLARAYREIHDAAHSHPKIPAVPKDISDKIIAGVLATIDGDTSS